MFLFNIYYINFSKVYEIKMILSNIVQITRTIETGKNKQNDTEIKAKMGLKFLTVYNGNIDSDMKSSVTDSQRVLDTFKVTMTKSIILNEIIEKCDKVSLINDIDEGKLIKIDNVNLSLINEAELRTVKMFYNGSFKGMKLQEAGGMDINNLFNSMFKDYSYKIKGTIEGSNKKLLIKIPLSFENEFENKYNVDDLFIGKVSIIGLYKGKTNEKKLKNSFEFFQEYGNNPTISNCEDEIHNSQNSISQISFLKDEKDDNEYHYIDLLSIIQDINIKSLDNNLEKKKRNKFFSKFLKKKKCL